MSLKIKVQRRCGGLSGGAPVGSGSSYVQVKFPTVSHIHAFTWTSLNAFSRRDIDFRQTNQFQLAAEIQDRHDPLNFYTTVSCVSAAYF